MKCHSKHLRGEYGSTSSTLLEQIKQDDAIAWDRTVKLYAPLVYFWCRQSGLSNEDSFEISQELFLAIHRSLDGFERKNAGDTFRGWLRTIAKRKIADHYRSLAKRLPGETRQFDSELSPVDFNVSDLIENDDPIEHDEEMHLLIQRAIQIIEGEFQAKHQRAFELMILEGWRAKDVALKLDMTVNAVYMARHHILRRLKQEFADLLE